MTEEKKYREGDSEQVLEHQEEISNPEETVSEKDDGGTAKEIEDDIEAESQQVPDETIPDQPITGFLVVQLKNGRADVITKIGMPRDHEPALIEVRDLCAQVAANLDIQLISQACGANLAKSIQSAAKKQQQMAAQNKILRPQLVHPRR